MLDTREQYLDSTIAQMYDPQLDYPFAELGKAHAYLDALVEDAYGLPANADEIDVVAHLFKLYSRAVG